MQRLPVRVGSALVLCACGGGPPPGDGDAGGSADAAVLAGEVTVTVFDDGVPAPQARVLVHDASGNLVAERRTNGQGRTTIDAPVGGSVSAVWTDELGEYSSVAIQTVLAIEAGDAIELDRALTYVPETPPPVASITVEPGGAPPASYYDVRLGCTSVTVESLPATVDVPAACLGSDGAVDVLVTAVQVSGGEARIVVVETIAYAAARVTLTDGQGSYTPAAWNSEWDAVPVSIAPPLDSYVGWTLHADGLTYDGGPRSEAGLGLWRDLTVDGAGVSGLAATDDGYAVFERRYEGVPAEVALGPADILPDPVGPVGLADADGRTVLSWDSSQANVAAADGLYASVGWEGAGVADGRYRWELVAPPDRHEIALPALPDDLASIVSPVDLETWDYRIELLDASWMDSYADLRASRLHGGLYGQRLLDLPSGDALLRRTGNGPLFP